MAGHAARHAGAARHGIAAIVVLTVTACGVPLPQPPDDAGVAPATGGTPLVTTDVGGAALVAQLEAVDVAAAAVADALDAAGAAATRGDLEAVRTAGAAAVALLLGDEDRVGMLPAVDPDRAGPGSADLISATVTLAGDVGGEQSRIVLELVRDPLVGDLGAWQRDPIGVVALVRAAVADAGADTAALDAGLAEIPGELTRVLGYALAVASAPDATLAAHAATAGSARLGVVRVALELGVEALSATTVDPTVGADASDGR